MATSNLCKDENDESKIQHETRGDASPSLAKYLHIMNSYGREIIFVIALIFTGIAALQNGYGFTASIPRPKFKFSPARLPCTGVNKVKLLVVSDHSIFTLYTFKKSNTTMSLNPSFLFILINQLYLSARKAEFYTFNIYLIQKYTRR